VLFSLPSLLGKKSKKGNAGQKTVVSGENTPETAVYADDEDTIEEIKRRVFGQSFDIQPKSASSRQEQFLYNEYNPEQMQEENKQPKASPVFVKPEPVVEQGCSYSFDLRQAVIQSVILENPYIN
jgi:hypothetical protein